MIAWLAAAALARVTVADHHGTAEGDGVAWTSTFAGDGDRILLADPIPAGEVRQVTAGDPVEEDGRLVAVDPRGPGPVVIRSTQRGRDAARPPLALDPDALQQVSLQGLRFEPAPALGLVARVGWSGPADLDPSAREAALRGLPVAWSHRHGAALVVVGRPVEALDGAVVDAGRVPIAVVLAAAVAALGLCAGLWAGHRALERLARRERLDAWLADATRAPADE